jgi:hypothetical protein
MTRPRTEERVARERVAEVLEWETTGSKIVSQLESEKTVSQKRQCQKQ